MNKIIELRQVGKTYNTGEAEVKALQNFNIEIQRGDFVAIMGPSGSGKYTSMNMIGSLDVPTEGNIYLDGQDIAHLEESDLAVLRGKKIGFIFQQFNLIGTLTAMDNVMLPMIFQGMSREDREARARYLLESVGLEHRMYHYPTQLSGGEMQRVAIARALANDPEVILADEPTGNLDSKRGEEIMQFLDKLNKEGKTIIMVTHDQALAEKHARTIYYIRDGTVFDVKRKVKKGKDSFVFDAKKEAKGK
jgi:putative ABC transport system ATP-binding protein